MEDGCARRRLQFCDEPYKNKSFYIDVKTKSMHNRVSSSITQLGGTVETFLSKDIFMFVTDAKTSRLQNLLSKPSQDVGSTTSTDVSLSPYSPNTGTDSQNFPGVGNQHISLMSRGRALLMKARENSKDSICTNNSTDSTSVNSGSNSAVVKAFQMGIKIEHAINFLRKCKNIGVNFKAVKKSKNDDLSGFASLKWDNKNFIKVEDMSKQYRPIFKQIDNLPKLYTDNCSGSPFDGPTFLNRIQSETTTKKEMKGRKFTQGKGGYCEMCEQWYNKSLKEHMHGSNHLEFVKNKDNFSTLDNLVSQLPSVSDFFAKFAPSMKHSIVDTNECHLSPLETDSSDKTDSSATIDEELSGFEMENILQNPTHTSAKELFPNKEIFPLLFSDGKLFDNNVLKNDHDTNMFSTDNLQSESPTTVLKDLLMNWTLQDTVKPSARVEHPVAETTGNSIAGNVRSDVTDHSIAGSIVMSDATGNSNAGNVMSDPTIHSIAGNIVMSDATGNSNAGNVTSDPTVLSIAGNIVMSDTFGNSIAGSVMTDAIIHSLVGNTVMSDATGNSIAGNMSDATCTPVASDENYSGTTSLYGNNTDEPMSLGTPILSLDCNEDNLADDDGQMKLKGVYGNGESLSSAHMSNNFSRRGREKKQKLRKVKTRNKTDIYCSRKTSDTKLKLCKVSVTPLQQKCNLKMFWQVRKTGDCKLVFSSKKRKKAREDSVMSAGGRERDEEQQDRPLKRQRLVF